MQPAVEDQQLATRCEVVDADLLHREADPPAHLAPLRDDVEPGDGRAPAGGRTSVPSMPIVVDFPAPLGPRMPKTSPARTRNEIPRTASVPFV